MMAKEWLWSQGKGAWLASLLAGWGMVWACSPEYPIRMLGWGNKLFQASPTALSSMFPLANEPPPAVEKGLWQLDAQRSRTLEVDKLDLDAAAPGLNDEFFDAYCRCRLQMQGIDQLKDQDFAALKKKWELDVWLKELPREFQHYLEGAIAYHRGDSAAARRAWIELLALPGDERMYRTSWAYWMLAKTSSGPGKSLGWFKQLEKSLDEGFHDSLEIGKNRQGWRARFAYLSGEYALALDTYLEMGASGDLDAAEAARAVKLVLNLGLQQDGEAMMEMCALKPERRQAFSLYLCKLIASGLRWGDDSEDSKSMADAWLKVLDGHEVAQSEEMAGVLARVTYEAGMDAQALRYAALAAKENPDVYWVKGKLEAKGGRFAQAEKSFASYLALIDPEQDGGEQIWESEFYATSGKKQWLRQRRTFAYGDYAAVLLAQEKYAEALRAFLDGGFMSDAAYVAESLMGVEELLVYVRKQNIQDAAGHEWLSRLLGRRLARERYFKNARTYLPEADWKAFDSYVERYRRAMDESLPKEQRAQLLWSVAEDHVTYGRRLFWLSNGCRPYPRAVAAGLMEPYHSFDVPEPVPSMSAGELNRLKRYGRSVTTMTPVHYYDAGELAWKAAHLLPRQDPRAAAMFWQAGMWIAAQDPERADRYYKALVRRCGQTPLGKLADEKRWFPVWQEEWRIRWDAPESGILTQ
ncbi:hypothetical protein HW115_10510 [Verrucomicrobiaceae bacterium N1E253]|uniref:Uncharacterized protein n=1 Tax=Oceaniferula marina TaxID=2748318 RepID=A0A851GPH3_9BACT|nr:hypothetical protein [Oceaniferula marina]NWK56044.1 hypothetical protein [Oceaniferula marina]